jgi:hypothetical protein
MWTEEPISKFLTESKRERARIVEWFYELRRAREYGEVRSPRNSCGARQVRLFLFYANCITWMQFGDGFCLSRSYNMMLKPQGISVPEQEFEEVDDFNRRLQKAHLPFLRRVRGFDRNSKRWGAMEAGKNYLVKIGVHAIGKFYNGYSNTKKIRSVA